MTSDLFGTEQSTATLSEDGCYRYHLWRGWATATPGSATPMSFVMLNPSTADATVDDPTIRRCIGFAKREGCTSINVVNLFAWRSPTPSMLLDIPDPVGPDNHWWLDSVLDIHDTFDAPLVVAWGAGGPTLAKAREAIRFVDCARARGVQLLCLGETAAHQPRHPLYLPGAEPLLPFGDVR